MVIHIIKSNFTKNTAVTIKLLNLFSHKCVFALVKLPWFVSKYCYALVCRKYLSYEVHVWFSIFVFLSTCIIKMNGKLNECWHFIPVYIGFVDLM